MSELSTDTAGESPGATARATPTEPHAEAGKGVEALVGRRAGVVSRSIAFAVDCGVVLVGYPLILGGWALLKGVVTFSSPDYPDPDAVARAVLNAVWVVSYFTGSWLLVGRTVGQALMGLRVVRRDRVQVGPLRCLLRFWVLFLSLPVAFAWLALSRRRLGLHDLASGTQVVHDPKPRRSVVDVALGPRGPSGSSDPPGLEGRSTRRVASGGTVAS